MASPKVRAGEEVIFRRHLLWVLVDLAQAGLLALISLGATLSMGQLWPLAGLPLAVFWAIIINMRYQHEAIILRGTQLVFRTGLLVVCEQPYQLLIYSPTTAQGPLGRWLNYGTVTISDSQGSIWMRRVEKFPTLRRLLAARQTVLVAREQQIIPVR